MLDVVQQVAGERVHRERRSVAAAPPPLPRIAGDCVEAVGQPLPCTLQLVTHDGRILTAVVLVQCGRVLVPVVIERIGLREHPVQPMQGELVYVANMAALPPRGPAVVSGPPRYVRRLEHGPPLAGVRTQA